MQIKAHTTSETPIRIASFTRQTHTCNFPVGIDQAQGAILPKVDNKLNMQSKIMETDLEIILQSFQNMSCIDIL